MVRAVISPESRRQFLRDVKEFQKRTGKSTENVMDMVAVSCARQLMGKTLPVGMRASGGPPSGDAFQSSIMAQVYRALKKNMPAIRDGESVESIHKRARGSKGVVEKSPRDKENAAIPFPTRAVLDQAYVLVRKMQHRAGLAKAAWLTAMESLGTFNGKVPKYVKRHQGRASGSATRRGSGMRNYTVTLANQVAHMNRRLCPDRMIAQALKVGYGVIAWELDKVLNGGKPTKITLRKKR